MNFESLLSKYKLSTLELGRQKCFVIELFKIKNNLAPIYLTDIVLPHYNTRQKSNCSTECKDNNIRIAFVWILVNKNLELSST